MDRRVSKTRAAIHKAYMELIKEKGLARISVTELARRADIDRKTFYLHYTSPDDVLEEQVTERFNRAVGMMEDTRYFDDPFNVEKLLSLLDTFYKEEEDLLIAVAESGAVDDLWRRVHDILSDKVVELYRPLVKIDREEIRIYFDFFGTGVIEVYQRWVKGDYSYDLHRLAEMISDAANRGLGQFFNERG